MMRLLSSHPRVKLAAKILLVWLALPYVLTLVYLIVPPPSTPMLWDLVTGKNVQRHWVPLSQLPPVFVQSVLTSEDSAFCDHFGMDFTQIAKSIRKAQKTDKPVKATSTITQQTVKNLFFWNGRSWVRKVLEAPVTLWLELVWSKERILETYLNIAQWGDGVYGVEAAARVHFGVAARSLSPYQSALLATSLPNPIARNAGRPGPAQKELTAALLFRTQKGGADLSCIR
ncbi:MAG: monofunctional biosynthetic peptidoglycan transglycosylase [Alphaproteobacteria bacterium]|nr:monofunctional biosynthetic peptidoglycan transglycosylase [Alphaproteobacteria bacterium]